jgi:hypothetical protein
MDRTQMVDESDNEPLNIPVMGNWDAGTLPPPPGREHEADPCQTDEQLLDLLQYSYDESVMWRRVYPPKHGNETTSFFGGRPLLAENIPWPRSADNQSSLMFVGQIDLAHVPEFSHRGLLPNSGILYFFLCGMGLHRPDVQLGRVIADYSGSTPVPRTPPADVIPMWGGSAPRECDWVTKDQLFSFKYYREFPRYDVAPVLCRFFRDHHPTHCWGKTGQRYQDLWRREQSREVISAFGNPHGRWWPDCSDYYRPPGKPLEPVAPAGKPQPRPETFGIEPRIHNEPWLPDGKWPYSWLFVRIAVSLLIRGVAEPYFRGAAIHQLEIMMRKHPEHADYYAQHIARYKHNVEIGRHWLGRITNENMFLQLPQDEHQKFRHWIVGIGQPELYLDPQLASRKVAYELALAEWKQLGSKQGALPRLPYEGEHDKFWQSTVNKCISTSLIRGVELSLLENLTVAASIPQGVVEFLRWRHEPLHDHGSRFIRHQLMGAPRILQPTGMDMAKTHLLLMQFDTDEPMHWMWGDMGVLHYWITRQDLQEKKLENVIVTIDG